MWQMDELSPRERAMLSSLPRARVGSAALEDRVVTALVQRGMLRRTVMAFGRAPWRMMVPLSAAAAVFLMSAVLGRTSQAADVAATNEAAGTSASLAVGTEENMLLETAASIGDSIRLAAIVSGAMAARHVTNSPLMPAVERMGSTYAGAFTLLRPDTVQALARIARDLVRTTYRAAALQLARTRADSMFALAPMALPEPVAR
jgi:hypothetical protein